MDHLFLNETEQLFPSWQEAFPGARFASPKQLKDCPQGTVWLRSTAPKELNSLLPALRGINPRLPLVVLADEPDEAGAFQAIGLGAAGYCNSRAAPEVLRTIARVVHDGGLWLGQHMMRRILATLAHRLDATRTVDRHFADDDARLAKLLIRGADYREIASQLGLSETAVPQSVSALLARAGVQDCLQLLLKAGQPA